MTTIKTLSLMILSFMVFSCNTKAKEEKNDEVQTEKHEHSNDESIQLNDGQKWKVDDNMMLYIRNMENDVTNFDTEKDKNYSLLSDNLQKNLDLLTSNCTMGGQAHDELHKWLLPFIDLVDNFSKEKSVNQLAEIKESFITFNQYFQ